MYLSTNHSIHLLNSTITDHIEILARLEEGVQTHVDDLFHVEHCLARVVVPHEVVEDNSGDLHDADV